MAAETGTSLLTPKRSPMSRRGNRPRLGGSSGGASTPPSASPRSSSRSILHDSSPAPSTIQSSRTVTNAAKKMEAVHAAEVHKLQRKIADLEEARANLLRATKHLTQPLEQAHSAEVSKRRVRLQGCTRAAHAMCHHGPHPPSAAGHGRALLLRILSLPSPCERRPWRPR